MYHLGSGYNWPDACDIYSPVSSCELGVYLLLWGYVTCSGGLHLVLFWRGQKEKLF